MALYAFAQLALGLAYIEKDELDNAIVVLKRVPESMQEQYADAQLQLGIIYHKKGEVDKAIKAYERVSESAQVAYAKAQINLGVIYHQKGEVDKAIEMYMRVPESEQKVYANAQVNLGVVYSQKGEVDEEIKAYKRVPESEQEQYAKAQFNLGIAYRQKGEVDEAVKAYKRVPESEQEAYAKTQVNLGNVYRQKGEIDEAIEVYKQVSESEQEAYANAQFNLGEAYSQKNNINEAIKAYKSVPKELFYLYRHSQLKIKIFTASEMENLKNVYDDVENILNLLQVKSENFSGAELNIAHYTRPNTAFLLLKEDEKKNVSPFRLSSISDVNDPTEGDVLYKWLDIELEKSVDETVFISCFTFNHDSLNQFRLYGKENNEEATGVSLVFNGNHLFTQDFAPFSGIENTQMTGNKNSLEKGMSGKVQRLPLYRCIYLDMDSESDYINIASRERITFFREKNPKLDIDSYMNEIDVLRSKIKEELDNIKTILTEIKNNEAMKIVAEILLPLRYLVKHASFEQEQEARIFYIASLFDSKIKTDPTNTQMYVEYDVPVKSAIHKMYLSPGAEKYKDFFRRCINDKEGSKVIISSNPFRNKKY